jgi:hypothetical protein
MADLASSVTTNPQVFIPSVFAGTVPVAPVVQASQAATTTIQQMQFPEDLPKYYTSLAAIDWGQQANSVVLQNTDGQIFLPLPDQLIDAHGVRWNQANLLAEFFDSGGKILAGLAGSALGRSLAQSVNAISHTFGAVGTGVAAGGLAQAGLTALRAFGGVAPNQFITILFESPEYKQHQLTWTLACNTPKEAEQIRKIIQYINNNMAPAAGAGVQNVLNTGINIPGGLYWEFPSVWLIKFNPNDDYIFKFKPAVLTNFLVDYAGGHAPSFHRADPDTTAGASTPQNAPVSVIIHAQFVEIEYWRKGDFVTNTDLDNAVAIAKGA